ncbi:MAG: chromate transporter [Ruminococcaceae bacterium]|nr:chromate transporter [Oscillospiraceae bacterium]MBE6896962.1 chromate transporter [Oscillospiraceae bacterium]
MLFLELFLTFFKIGAFTFGGGYAMLPLVQAAVIEKGWLSETQIVDFIAVSESTPGPFAINIATYVGSQMGGIFGAFCCTLGVVLPSFIIILLVAKFFEKFKNSKTVSGCMSGLKPAVIGLISSAVISIGTTVFFPVSITFAVFKTAAFYVSAVIFGIMMIASMKKVSPILIIVGSAVLGILAGYIFNIQI